MDVIQYLNPQGVATFRGPWTSEWTSWRICDALVDAFFGNESLCCFPWMQALQMAGNGESEEVQAIYHVLIDELLDHINAKVTKATVPELQIQCL